MKITIRDENGVMICQCSSVFAEKIVLQCEEGQKNIRHLSINGKTIYRIMKDMKMRPFEYLELFIWKGSIVVVEKEK